MPNRLSESILADSMNKAGKLKTIDNKKTREYYNQVLEEGSALPFLAIESDGSPFPQVIEARLETMLMRASRLHERLMAAKIRP
jgi:hypothetical protein